MSLVVLVLICYLVLYLHYVYEKWDGCYSVGGGIEWHCVASLSF